MSQQSAIYNHRPLQPTGAVPPPGAGPQPGGPATGGPTAPGSASASASRLSELLEIVRQEFDNVAAESVQLRSQRDEYEGRVGGQINELTAIRNALYDLESQHAKIRQTYEGEIMSLKAELAAMASSQQTAAAQQQQAPQPPPPHTQTSSGIPAHLPTHPAHPPPSSSYPPPQDAYYSSNIKGRGPLPPPLGPNANPDAMQLDPNDRDRDRDRDRLDRERESQRDRDREMRERERERERDRRDLGKKGMPTGKGVGERELVGPPRPASSAQIGGPTQVTPKLPATAPVSAPPPSTSPYISSASRDRDTGGRGDARDRDMRERERAERERELRDRDRDNRMVVDRDDHPAPPPPPPTGNTPHPYGGSGPGPSSSAGPPPSSSSGSTVHGPPPAPPSYSRPGDRDREREEEKYRPEQPAADEAPPANGGGPAAATGANGPLVPSATNSSVGSGAGGPPAAGAGPNGGVTMSQLMDMDPENVPAEYKKNGSDWYAIFNPQVARVLDINLVMSLAHESVVCCVRFSADGKYLATGCNRTAQIYDTKTGAKTCVLADDNVTLKHDLYIRSVCFSPDGKLLATGAEDKRVRIWDIAKRKIRTIFDGHSQEIYSLDFSRDGRKIVSGSGDKTCRIWDLESGEATVLAIIEPDSVDAGVTSVAISPDGRHVAAGSLDTIVRIWDVATGNLIERLRGHADSVYSVAFTHDGKGIVSGSLDKSLKYWSLEPLLRHPNRTASLQQGGSVPSGQQPVAQEGGEKGSTCTVGFSGHKDYVLSVAASPDGSWVVSGSKDRGVQFWDPRSSQTQLMLQGHKNSVISIDLSPTLNASKGGLLATGSGDWCARVWSYGPA